MKHTIVSWDASFRSFHHLVDGLLRQDFDRDQFQLIYVEQRTREHADACNHRLGLRSLGDRAEEVGDRINFQVVYLGDNASVPFHLGKCNNAGIERARGENIAVMDGDLLLPKNFLTSLSRAHEGGTRVLNLLRRMAEYPVGVWLWRNWTRGRIDFDACWAACTNRLSRIPRSIGNKGPMISARRDLWHAIGGYDPGPVWRTSASKAGGDVNARLELAAGSASEGLPDVFAVHPWHPTGFARKGRVSHETDVLRYLDLQQRLIDSSVATRAPHWRDRVALAEKLHAEHRDLMARIWEQERIEHENGDLVPGVPQRTTVPTRLRVWYDAASRFGRLRTIRHLRMRFT